MRTCLDRLEAGGIIRRCDPDVVAARIKRADRRPKGWDLDLGLIRDDLTEANISVLEHQFPGLAARVSAAAGPDTDGAADGVQPPSPAALVDNQADRVQPLHPAPRTGCNQRSHGVQLAQPRGAAVAPEPSIEPSREPSAASARGREALPAAEGLTGGLAGEFFDALGLAWRLTAAQRSRLTPAVLAALDGGWAPQELARFAGANTEGVRNPYAVLAVRLSAAELPPPPGQRRSRPPWCGECDERTRMVGFYSDAPNPCPLCKPTACTQQDGPSPDSPHRLHRGHPQQAGIAARATRRRAQPVRREGAPGATFDPDPDQVCAGR